MLGESKVTRGLSTPRRSGSLSAELLKGQVCSLISPWVLGCIQGWMSSGGRVHKLKNQMSIAVDLSNFCLKHCCQEQPSAFKCLEKKKNNNNNKRITWHLKIHDARRWVCTLGVWLGRSCPQACAHCLRLCVRRRRNRQGAAHGIYRHRAAHGIYSISRLAL